MVVGAGLTGLTAAHTLARRGVDVTVYEQDYVVGGHARSETMRGIPYEPHGAHIFHTSDTEVWDLVTSLVAMLPYRHRVMTELVDEMFSWPLQISELHRLDLWPMIERELYDLPGAARRHELLETWCVSQMGPTLYDLFVGPYTEKQWGRSGCELAASLGPKRVELRTDGNRDLFRDPFQGWPAGGYGCLAEQLAAEFDVVMGQAVSVANLHDIVEPHVPVIVTSALDDFFLNRHGPLEWRGVELVGHWQPDVLSFAQPAMVVNRPSPDKSYTRTIETKWVLGEEAACSRTGTMVMYEYPGAPTKHYPVPDIEGINRKVQQLYEQELHRFERNPLIAAGRLARYTYIDMDQAMRSGLDAATEVRSE